MLRRGGCEGRGKDESTTSEYVGGGVWEGAELERRGGGRLAGGWKKQGNSNPWWSQPRRFCESEPGSGRSRSAPTWNRWSTLVSPYLPRESTRSRGNVGALRGTRLIKARWYWGNPRGGGGGDADVITRELV